MNNKEIDQHLGQDIPVVIFCGGQGTRMRGGSATKKELVEIGGRPIIWHVMRIYSSFGFNRFILPLGYEAQQIKSYFLHYEAMSRNFTIEVGQRKNRVTYHGEEAHPEWQVSLVDTGLHTEKASRLVKIADYIKAKRFFLTYGDGVGDINIQAVLDFHLAHEKLVTITAVQPHHYQYGTMEADINGQVSLYEQYPRLPYWINAGFMVFETAALQQIQNGADTALETGVLQEMIRQDQVMMFRHHGFWQSMDTLKDATELEEIWQQGAPWKTWENNKR